MTEQIQQYLNKPIITAGVIINIHGYPNAAAVLKQI